MVIIVDTFSFDTMTQVLSYGKSPLFGGLKYWQPLQYILVTVIHVKFEYLLRPSLIAHSHIYMSLTTNYDNILIKVLKHFLYYCFLYSLLLLLNILPVSILLQVEFVQSQWWSFIMPSPQSFSPQGTVTHCTVDDIAASWCWEPSGFSATRNVNGKNYMPFTYACI